MLDQATAAYIRQAAIARGIDPETALRVANAEGGGAWQSNFVKNGKREPSYGPFQLFTGGGLGNEFQNKTGLDPSDPTNQNAGIDFALDTAKAGGWGPWYGAKKAGITGMTGIGGPQPNRLGPPEDANAMPINTNSGGIDPMSLLGGLGQTRDTGGLLGLFKNPNTRDMLLSLGAGLASGANEGWGPGIGRGLALAQQSKQNNREDALQRLLLGLKVAEFQKPDIKDVTLPNGTKMTASVGPNGAVSPLDTSGLPTTPQSGFSIGDTKDRASVEGPMRKEFTSLSGDYIKVRDSYSKIQAATKDPSPAGDMATIFNYMRLLDPGSTVREGEYATAEQAAAVPDRIRNLYNNVLAGTTLTPNQRADFSKQAKGLFDAQDRQQKKLTKQYEAIATRLGIDPKNIIPDLSIAPDETMPGVGSPQTSTMDKKGSLGAVPKQYATPAEVDADAAQGLVQDGDSVIVGGRKATFHAH